MTSALKDFDKQWIEENTYAESTTKQGNGRTYPSTPGLKKKLSPSDLSRNNAVNKQQKNKLNDKKYIYFNRF